jgi:glucose-6-phosphate-specific signal transduction histidine kinase
MLSASYLTNTFSWIFHSDSSLKQQSVELTVVFTLTPYCCVLSEEVANTNCIVVDLTGARTHHLLDSR